MAVLAVVGTAITACAPVSAKTPGAAYCFLGVCHRVLSLDETKDAIGKTSFVIASHYDSPDKDRFNPSLVTSSGEIFRPGEDNTAASPILPDGTIVAVYVPSTRRGAIVRINNAGPYWGGRKLDLSRGLAEKLGVAARGIAVVAVEVLSAPTAREAGYVFGRRYAPVPGYVGEVTGVEAIRERQGQCAHAPACVAAQTAPNVATAAVATAAPSTHVQPDQRRRVTLLPVRLRRPAVLSRLGSMLPKAPAPLLATKETRVRP